LTATKTNNRTLDQPYAKLQGKSVRLEYVELKSRKTSKSLENRIEHYVKRRRIDEEFVNQKIKELNERKEQMTSSQLSSQQQQQTPENEESG
jgi:23S rRNA pseudoU1915 N3-methylase RlmH